jgi:hypothetical protein
MVNLLIIFHPKYQLRTGFPILYVRKPLPKFASILFRGRAQAPIVNTHIMKMNDLFIKYERYVGVRVIYKTNASDINQFLRGPASTFLPTISMYIVSKPDSVLLSAFI